MTKKFTLKLSFMFQIEFFLVYLQKKKENEQVKNALSCCKARLLDCWQFFIRKDSCPF